MFQLLKASLLDYEVSDNLLRVFAFLWGRELTGVDKYGVTLDDQPAEGYNGTSWPLMALEETTDALNYQQKEIRRLELELNNLREIAFGRSR